MASRKSSAAQQAPAFVLGMPLHEVFARLPLTSATSLAELLVFRKEGRKDGEGDGGGVHIYQPPCFELDPRGILHMFL
jgi:hypothetical protein